MAQKGATLVAGTGFQYGDDQLIDYSERIYTEFARQLRIGSGDVAVGTALVGSKLAYLAATPDVQGMHVKALLTATLYGLPMFAIDMPGARLPAATGASIVTPPLETTGGLASKTVHIDTSATTTHTVTSLDPSASYLSGPDGVASNPGEPALPRFVKNVGVPGQVLRGIGFRGGTFSEGTITPLVGAPGTEFGGAQAPFTSTTFSPAQMWTTSYFGDLTGGSTSLVVTPAQHRVVTPGDPTAIRRAYSSVDLQLFYADAASTNAAQASAPVISDVVASLDGSLVAFSARVRGSDAAGANNVKTAWLTYTFGTSGCSCWTSINLSRDANDPSVWSGTLDLTGLGGQADDLRFVVQAANSAALVGQETNGGSYYAITGSSTPMVTPTSLSMTTTGSGGPYGSTLPVSASLVDTSDQPISGKSIVFRIGSSIAAATTNAGGVATVQLPLVVAPGSRQVTATFAGDATALASDSQASVTVTKIATSLTINPTPSPVLLGSPSGVSATLSADGQPLGSHPIFFVLNGTGPGTQGHGYAKSITPQADGVGSLGVLPSLPSGSYSLRVYFNGTFALDPWNASPQQVTLTDAIYAAAPAAAANLTISPAQTTLTLSPPATTVRSGADAGVTALLSDSGLHPVSGRVVTFAVTGPAGSFTVQQTTDGSGLAHLGIVPASPGSYKVTADFAGDGSYRPAPQATSQLAVVMGEVLGSVALGDSTFKHVDNGLNVLFGKGATPDVMTLKNTDPGTFHYLLELDNETGIPLGDGHGASATTIITIPGIPSAGVNLTLPASTGGLTDPAFVVQGNKSIRVHPGEDDDHDVDAQVSYAYLTDTPGALGDCTNPGVSWRAGQPADGSAVKCVMISSYALPNRHSVRIDLNLELRIKNTTGWLSSENPTLNFRAGFPVKAVTTLTLDATWGMLAGTYPGNQITAIVGVGQAVTALGGFVFDTNGSGIGDATVRVYNAAPSAANFCTTTGQVAEYTTTPDGFYFISQTGVNDSTTPATGPNRLPSGVRYYIAVCNPPGIDRRYWPGRLIDNKLSNKEFDGEDFYVSAPGLLSVAMQPSSGKAGKTIGTIKVSVEDTFGSVVTADNSDMITLTAPAGSGLSGTLTVKVTSGVATFSGVRFSQPGTWALAVSASPVNWGLGTVTAPIAIK